MHLLLDRKEMSFQDFKVADDADKGSTTQRSRAESRASRAGSTVSKTKEEVQLA